MERKIVGLIVFTLLFSGLVSGIASAEVTCYTETDWSYIPGYFVECVTTTCSDEYGRIYSYTEICNYYPVNWYWDW